MRVTYWTGVWDPGREAISKEVADLRKVQVRPGPVVSLSLGQRSHLLPRDGVIRLSGRRVLLFAALARLVEPLGHVTHAVGAVDAWPLLRFLGRRPLVMTVALPGRLLDRRFYQRASLFAVESETLAAELRAGGVEPDRIRVVYPGVDLARFAPAPLPPARPLRVLFASTPSDPAEMERRGIPLLVEAARCAPGVEFVLLWRQWGNRAAADAALAALAPPPNVRVEHRDAASMAGELARVHATACAFANGFGKSCPNSVVEGLASGRPALLTEGIGIARLVAEAGAGVTVTRSVEGVLSGLAALRATLEERAGRARALAERHFDLASFRRSYADIYEELAGEDAVARRGQASKPRFLGDLTPL